jgi:hypothetical protein
MLPFLVKWRRWGQASRFISCMRRVVAINLLGRLRVKQVNQATKLKAKAGRLQESAAELLTKAKTEKETAASLKAT